MAGRTAAAMTAVALVSIVSLAAAGNAAAGTTDPPPALELLGPGAERTVRFIGDEAEFAIVVRNRSQRSGAVELVFVTNAGDLVRVTGRASGSAPISIANLQAATQPLGPGVETRLELHMRLRPQKRPADASGVLEVSLSGVDAPPLAVTLRGAPPDIVFDPPQLTIDVSQGCWLVPGTCGDTHTVLVRGHDALAWAQWASGREQTASGLAILNNDHGGSVTVRLEEPKILPEGVVSVRVDASDLNEAGGYEGVIPLDSSDPQGPALSVEVKVRWALAVAVSVIFGGALFGGFFLRRFEIYRRRRLLELELQSALERYYEVRGEPGRPPASYDLDSVLGPRRVGGTETLPYPGTRGVSAILWNIRTARDDEDFAEDIARTHALIGEIERWRTLEPVVRHTVDVLEDIPPARRDREFSDTRSYKDLATLRMRATTAPQDDAECERLVAALSEQGRVTIKCKLVWEQLERLESRTGWSRAQAAILRELDLFAIEERYGGFDVRTPEVTAELRAELDRAEQRLRKLSTDVEALLEESPRVAAALAIEARLQATERNPTIERAVPDFSSWRKLTAAFNQIALRSLFWTLARALVASAAYALTVYSDTWGSVTDFASAFTAGFLTETLVNWAVTPAFRSFRQRSAARRSERARAAEPAGAAETPAVDEGQAPSPSQPALPDM